MEENDGLLSELPELIGRRVRVSAPDADLHTGLVSAFSPGDIIVIETPHKAMRGRAILRISLAAVAHAENGR